MLSKEEKQAIDFLINKRGEVYRLMRFEDTNNYILAKKEFNNYCIIEELISNLQKENEELKQENERLKDFSNNLYIDDYIEDYIPKIKIKDLIEKLKQNLNSDNNIKIYTLKDSYELQINVLQELLESGDENECKK